MNTYPTIKLHLAALALLSSFILHPSSLPGQGSLTPPGAPAPTMKSLAQIEPRFAITNTGAVTITSAGSYYLTTNITVSTGDAITINPNGVTLDLNGWTISSTAQGWKVHDLIGSVSEGFSPYVGAYAAALGGYEGVTDYLTQTITIPAQGQLSYWWKMGTYENLPHSDHLVVNLNHPDGSLVASLANHDDADIEGVWQQDIIDLSAYAGDSYQIQFYVYNDNYYFTWFNIDEVHACGSL
jgi:hypothetical protein